MTTTDEMHQMRAITDVLMAEALDAPGPEFVQEVVFDMAANGTLTPPPPEPPVLTFGPDVWTLIQGTFGTIDDRGRTALAVGEGDPSPGSWTVFTAPCPLDADSDWAIVLTTTGEVNDDYTATIVEEDGGGGLELKVTEAVGIDEGDIISGAANTPNAEAFNPSITTYTAVHETGTTTIKINGTVWATGAGDGASGDGTVVITIPPGVAIFGLWIYDYALGA